ncbi:MAG: hypothetical protein ACTSWQ_09135 [Candidatus Thorarchaeota archaeon]
MAKVVECEIDRRVVIVTNEPVGYPNFSAEEFRLSYKEFERLNLKYGGHYGINWYLYGKDSIKYFDHQSDEWKVIRK